MKAIRLLALALVLALPGVSQAQYSWLLAESPGAFLVWPNELGSPNLLESDSPMRGVVLTEWVGTAGQPLDTPLLPPPYMPVGFQPNACELALSYPCDAGFPPIWLITPPSTAEGPPGGPPAAESECNRQTVACVPGPPHPPVAPPAHPAAIGEYSYAVIHYDPPPVGPPIMKSIAFISGGYGYGTGAYECNTCAPEGPGKDIPDAVALANTQVSAPVLPGPPTALWMTQVAAPPPTGHINVTFFPAGPPPMVGRLSKCGRGVIYSDLRVDLCSDGLEPPPGDVLLEDQKFVVRTYPVALGLVAPAGPAGLGSCNGPDCYIQNVIIPVCMAQTGGATTAVQMLTGTSILPAVAPPPLAGATIDTVIFSCLDPAGPSPTIDFDGDGGFDWVDPCPNDPTDTCVTDLITALPCPAGMIFCADAFGDLGCLNPFLCNQRIDPNQDCVADAADFTRVSGEDNGSDATEAFASTVPIGPFDP